MKLSVEKSLEFLRSPDRAVGVVLIYGPDTTLIGEKKDSLLQHYLGESPDPFRRSEIRADVLRKTPAALADACAMKGLGGAQPVVICQRLTDTATKSITHALAHMPVGAHLVLTAGELRASSSLRKAIEAAPKAVALPVYPPRDSQLESALEAMLDELGVPAIEPEALGYLLAMVQSLEYGQIRRHIETLALYKYQDPTPISLEDVTVLAPPAHTTLVQLTTAIAQAQISVIPALLRRLGAYGTTPAELVREVKGCFVQAHAVALGASTSGFIYTPHKKAITTLAARRHRTHLEHTALSLHKAEAHLRRGASLPERAFVERVLLRATLTGSKT